MAIKTYKKEEKKLKDPMFHRNEYGEFFVNEDGEYIATIKFHKEAEMCRECKNVLEFQNYRTDFAEWDKEGRLVRFLEEII